MQVKWKKNKNLKPSIILEKINAIKIVGEDNKVSYSAFEYQNARTALQSMVDFPSNLNILDQESIVSSAIDNVAKHHDLDDKKVINEINNVVKTTLANRELKFHILSTISLEPPFTAKHIKIEGCNIRLLDSSYPKKYKERDELITKHKIEEESTPSDYANLIISLKAKSVQEAVTKGLRALDIQRAVWCLFGNSRMHLMSDEWQPINKIRLGGVHTIHKENGKVATNICWYEPNFEKVKPFSPRHQQAYSKSCKRIMEQLSLSPYSFILKDSLLRYVRALDEKDQNIALIRLWGAIESLAAPAEANYDKVTQRCSFLFKERDYHQQILEHLREYRNSSIHAGDQSGKAKTNCFQLQYYFYHLILFHLGNNELFKNLEEANNFLDLPSSKEILENRKRLIEKALDFRS